MNYSKLLWALLGTVALGLQTGLSDGVLSLEDGLLVLTAAGVWALPNKSADNRDFRLTD